MTDLLDTVESFGVFIYLNAADDLNAYSVEDVEDNFDFKYLKDIDVEVFANNLISAVKAARVKAESITDERVAEVLEKRAKVLVAKSMLVDDKAQVEELASEWAKKVSPAITKYVRSNIEN